MGEREKKRADFLINLAYWVVIIALIYFIFKYFINLVMPFFLALILAAVARPIALFLSAKTKKIKASDESKTEVKRKFSLNYNVAAILSVILILILAAGLISLIAVPVISFLIDKLGSLPAFYTNTVSPALTSWLYELSEYTSHLDGPLSGLSESLIPNLTSYLGNIVSDVSGKVLVWASSLATTLPAVLMRGLIMIIATFFIVLDFDSIISFTRNNLSKKTFDVVVKVRDSLVSTVGMFLRSYALIFLITTAEIAIGLLIIGIDRPLFFAILIAVFDAFPIVGSGMILLPWAIITLLTGSVWQGVGLLILYLVVVIAREIIEPKIVGRHVGLNPIVTLLGMYVGNKLFGGLGLFGLPIAAAIISDLNSNENGLRLFNPAGELATKEPETPVPEAEEKDGEEPESKE